MTASQTEGFEELDKLFKELGSAASGKALRQSVGVAMTPVVKQARVWAPEGGEFGGEPRTHRTYKGRLVTPGFLSRNIGKSTFLSKSKNFASASVAPRGEAWYGKLFSSSLPRPFKTKNGTRDFPEDDFLAEAFDAKKDEMIRRFYDALGKRLDKALRKSRKK